MKYLRRIMNILVYIPYYTMCLHDATVDKMDKDSLELARRFFRYKLYLAKKK